MVEVGCELMHQPGKLNPLGLGDRSLDPWQRILGNLLEREYLALPHRIANQTARRDGMTPKSVLGDISDRERGHAFPSLEFGRSLAQIGFLHVVDIVLIPSLEYRLQALLDPRCGLHRKWQGLKRLGQLRNGRHPDFVPIEIGLLQLGKTLIGLLDASVLQAASVEEMLKHRPFRRIGKGLVMFPEGLQ